MVCFILHLVWDSWIKLPTRFGVVTLFAFFRWRSHSAFGFLSLGWRMLFDVGDDVQTQAQITLSAPNQWLGNLLGPTFESIRTYSKYVQDICCLMVLFNYRRPPWDKKKKNMASAKRWGERTCVQLLGCRDGANANATCFFHHHLEMFVGHDPSDVGVILTWDLLPPLHSKIFPFYHPVLQRWSWSDGLY